MPEDSRTANFWKKSNCKRSKWHFHFWPFWVAFENFFAEAYSTKVSGAFWRSHQRLPACIKWISNSQWLMSNTAKFKVLPTVGLWPLPRLHWGWFKILGYDLIHKGLEKTHMQFGGLNLSIERDMSKNTPALHYIPDPVVKSLVAI